MKYLLGLDGGGTKTDVVLCETDGRVVRRCVGGASSMTGQTEESACGNIRKTVLAALGTVPQSDVLAVYAGISGGGLDANRLKYRVLLDNLLGGVPRRDSGSDCVNVLSSCVGSEDGIIAIAGTGSSVFARSGGVLHQVGGWGYLLGDEGSGFDLGRRALMAALMDMDGRGRKTSLYRKCEEKAGCRLRDLVAQLYRMDSKTAIAAYAPVLLQEAEAGDAAASGILHTAAEGMASAIQTAASKCKSRRVALGGSIWKNGLYLRTVAGMLGNEFEMILPTLPPVYGALVEAAAAAGLRVDEAFRNRFASTLREE